MTARIANVSIHAEDPAALARFWCAVMGHGVIAVTLK
jgi:hypothetical protein